MGFCESIQRKVHAACAFSAQEWWILGQAWALLLVADVGLRVLPFGSVRGLVAHVRKSPADSQPGEAWPAIQHLHRLVSIAGRYHLYPMRCLRQALVLQWLLGRRGIVTHLQIGVRKEAQGFRAHAWLEYDGQPIGDPQGLTDPYAPLAALPTGE